MIGRARPASRLCNDDLDRQPLEQERSAVDSSATRSQRSRLVVPFLVLVAFVVPTNLLHVARVATISPIDELMHIDYLIRASAPGFQRMSDQFSQEAMHEIACRRHPTDPLPACGDRPYVAEDFYWKGRNVASTHSPYYYVATGVPARMLRAVLPGESIVTWARVLGSVWLLGGMWLILQASTRLGFSPWSSVSALAVLALSPATQHAATTVNPDATAVLAGGFLFVAAVRALDGSAGIWLLAVASAVAYLLDPGNLVAVAGASLLVLVGGSRTRTVRQTASLVLGLAMGFVFATVAQMVMLNWLGVVDYAGSPQSSMFGVSSLTGPMIWGRNTLLAMLPPTQGYVFPALDTPAHGVGVAVALVVTTAAVVTAAVRPSLGGTAALIAPIGLLLLLIAPTLLVLLNYVQLKWYFPIPARYGLSLLPFVAVAVSDAIGSSRAGRVLAWLVAAALAAATLTALA